MDIKRPRLSNGNTNPHNQDFLLCIIDFLDIPSICILLQTSKKFRFYVNKSKRDNRKIIKLEKLPSNSILFENICYFRIDCKTIDNIPVKQNETHLIYYQLPDKYRNSSFNIESFWTLVMPFFSLISDNVHYLDLSGLDGITNVSALANVHTLNLSRCRNITDVSALGNVHTLSLRHCYKIRDVSALGNVHNLDLSCCEKITDVSDLSNVYTFYFSECKE